MRIPDKLINFNVFDNGQRLGAVDVELPNFEYMTETLNGAGIAGEIETPTLGHFASMPVTINKRVVDGESTNFVIPTARMVDFRGSVQEYDSRTGKIESFDIRLTMNCLPKTYTTGTAQVASMMDSSVELETTYLCLYVRGKKKIEIDKVNFICMIDGVDYLEKVRAEIGM